MFCTLLSLGARQMSKVICTRCGEICEVEGDFPKYYVWCDNCKRDYLHNVEELSLALEVEELVTLTDGSVYLLK